MKFETTIISICVTSFFLCGACSEGEQPLPPVQKTKVVMPIKRPTPEKTKTSPPTQEVKAKPEVKDMCEVKTAAVDEKAQKVPEQVTKGKEAPVKEKAGYYIVKKGDSLSSIAGKKAVYGDPLKWPILYRLNMDKLGNIQAGKNFADRAIPKDLRIRFLTSAEVKQNLKKRTHGLWVVNILSATTKKKIVPAAVKLIKEGYPVYIASAKVKGKDWMRLRVGFFKDREEANINGKKVMEIINLTDSWSTKVDEKELEEFGGY
ncbi:MAG: SPOR domain-containing protein [Deltaproteobacteria bacterium]|nr:SPOR domain-containing protein [Deltaproteobacteria bacterium]